jgi:ATP-dependent RNA helicase RhlE
LKIEEILFFMTFEQLNLIAPILDALKTAGYSTPTPIQAQAIPEVLQQRDLLACAQTGTGKTAAFSLPIIQLLQERNQNAGKGPKKIKALILTPTRELAIQIAEQIDIYGKNTGIRQTVIFGGVGQSPQAAAIRKGVDILIATPGRLLDLHGQGLIDLKYLEIFVLDEADRMLDMGFIHDVKRILKVIPTERQSLFFSATMPDSIIDLANSILTDPVQVSVTPVSSTTELIQQQLYFTDTDNKKLLLLHLLENKTKGRALVFTRTKYGADKLAKFLNQSGIKAEAIHGNKSQQARQLALSQFKASKIRVLVATDIAARGIDVEELEFVINFEVPNVPETYVHRIGRSGRAGVEGTAITICDESERPYVKDIQKLIKMEIPLVEYHDFLTARAANREPILLNEPPKVVNKVKGHPSHNKGKEQQQQPKKKTYGRPWQKKKA